MPITIGNNSGVVRAYDSNQNITIYDNSGRVRLGDDVQYYVGNYVGCISGLDGDEEEEALIRQNIRPCAALSLHQANFEEIKSWIKTCECEHQNLSSYSSADLPVVNTETSPGLDIPSLFNHLGLYPKSPLRLIDVEDQCVVETSTPLRYFALSYTWGLVEQVKLETRTLSQFLTKGSLAEERILLPKTIRDAMTLTSRLKERYLWADVLCIIQNDKEDQRIQIGNMFNIYANSVLTIVAGEGKDADAGLSRVNDHATDQLMGHDALRTAQASDESKGGDWMSLLDSVWASRAWTYQETILSKRLLLVLQDRIDLSCGHLLFSEGNAEPKGPILHPRFESFLDKIDRRTGLELYEHAVQSYSKLDLTKPEDILLAFDGILSRLRPYLRSGYVFGLPDTELESALAWRSGPVLSDWNTRSQAHPEVCHLARRRHSLDARQILNPSWSWAGWVGQVHYHRSVWPVIVGYVQWKMGGDSTFDFLRDSLRLRFGENECREAWSWHSDGFNPVYFADTEEPKVRFSNVIEPEHERQKFLQLRDQNLVFVTTCISLNLVAVEDLKNEYNQQSCRAAMVPPTMKCLPIVDHEHFRGGMIDTCELPGCSADAKKSDCIHTPRNPYLPVSFVLEMARLPPNQVQEGYRYQKGWQLILLSRFTGFANTVEDPHRFSRPKYEDSTFLNWDPPQDPLLNNIRKLTPLTSPVFQDKESEREGDEKSKRKDEDQPFPTYDTRRYETNKYYPFYSVLLIEWNNGVARRLGSGQVHVDAFENANPFTQRVVLG